MKRVRITLAILLCIALSVPVISNAITIYPFGSTYLYTGDANLDGKINSDDALFILKYLRGDFDMISQGHMAFADANLDESVDIDDAILILGDKTFRTYRVTLAIGDVNLDNSITVEDANLLLRYCNGLVDDAELALIIADCNWDGVVDTDDVLAILDYIS